MKTSLPSPTLTISKADARRFLLAHQRLWPPKKLEGKAGVLEFIRHVGCIQFDPLNIVGTNPDLVLQSRVANYTPRLLDELLYTDRRLVDGFDKMASIYSVDDWPYFARRRLASRQMRGDSSHPSMQVAPAVLQAIRERGPLSSIDLDHGEQVDWFWGPTRQARACLETLHAMGQVVTHHRVGTRRVFDLAERVLPAPLLSAPDPNVTREDYEDWHVLRRVGGLGLSSPAAAEYWLGILDVKSEARKAALTRLVGRGWLAAVAVKELPRQTWFVRAADLPTLKAVRTKRPPRPRAAIIAPLDNLMWDRNLLRWIFDFDYVWEVYKPARQRKYGYYVLPVVYGDRFVARFDPAFDKTTRELTIMDWWWEADVQPDKDMQTALGACLGDFARYLGAARLRFGKKAAGLAAQLEMDAT